MFTLFLQSLVQLSLKKLAGGYPTQLSYSRLWINIVKGLQYFLDEIKTRDFTQALSHVLYGHSKILVDLPAINSHIYVSKFKDSLILIFQYFNEFLIDHGIHVSQLAVVHMTESCLLFSVHHLICDTGIVWIQFEPSR